MTDNPAPMNAWQEFLIAVAGLCICVWALLGSDRFMTRGIRATCAIPGAILLLAGLVFIYG